MKITNSEKALVEHYVYATASAAVILWQRGGVANHNLKHVAFAALYGVIGPVLAKVNPRGLVAKLTKQEHLSAPEAAVLTNVVAAAQSDAEKALAKAAK
jgi:hypothetical protein